MKSGDLNLIEEFVVNHYDLWVRFCESMGIDSEEATAISDRLTEEVFS